jgi:hypothetical protein
MMSQLEAAFNITVDNDKAVSNPTGEPTHTHTHTHPSPILHTRQSVAYLLFLFLFYSTTQTLMSIVDKLERMLFEKFMKPKITAVTGKLRGGILDPKMDWYETPQPTGERRPSTSRRATPFLFYFFSDAAGLT